MPILFLTYSIANLCLGMVEGLISSIKNDSLNDINNSTVLISSKEIMNFVEKCENNE